MKLRYTVEILAAGQPRPYADSVTHVRVTLEHDYGTGKGWEASRWEDGEALRAVLKGLRCGFTDYVYDPKVDNSMEAHFRTRLDWLTQTDPGVWEFHTTSAYTD